MRKKVFGRKFSRGYNARKSLFRTLLQQLARHDAINTTYAKAKAVIGEVDKLTVIAKKEDRESYKLLVSFFGNDEKASGALVDRVKSFSKERKSGFARIVRLPKRKGDNAELARIEWVEKAVAETKKKQIFTKKAGKGVKPENKTEIKESIVKKGLSILKREDGKKADKSK